MIISILLTVITVFAVPLAAVLFATDAGMLICLLSFYVINPIVSVYNGIYAGFDIKKRWFSIFIPAAVFLATALILFSPVDPVFYLYSAFYLIFATVSALITALIFKFKK